MRSLKATGSSRSREASSSAAETRVPQETQPSVCTSRSCTVSRGFSTHWEPGMRITSLPLCCRRMATSCLGNGMAESTALRAGSLKKRVATAPLRMRTSSITTNGTRLRFLRLSGGRLMVDCGNGRSML